jgi:hypothetical protein
MDIRELVGAVELKGIECLQLDAERRADEAKGIAELVPETEDADLRLDVHPVHWTRTIEVWFRATVETGNARLVAAYAVQYSREDDKEIPDDVRVEFVERVAIMAVLPYVREAIHGLGARLRVPVPLLPILRQGEFKLADNPEVDDN